MCMGGGGAKASKANQTEQMFKDMIAQQNHTDALKVYQDQQAQQTQAFTAQLQKQIDESNAEAEKLQARQAELASAETAAKSAQMQGSYATETTATAPTAAQTTTKAAPKAKVKTGLKISPGAGAIAAGTGLNIGV